MKAAGHELKGLSALHRVASEARDERDAKALAESAAAVTKEVCGLGNLRTPLMVVVDYRGWRIVAMSVVPIGDGTLCYGSDDQARTVHRDPTVAAMMEDAGTVFERRFTRNIRCNASCAYVVVAAGARLNLKPHMVGTRGSQLTSIIGPCDIEVHRGSDGHLYVVEAPCHTTYQYSLRRAVPYHVAVWLCGWRCDCVTVWLWRRSYSVDTARVFPPEAPEKYLRALLLSPHADYPAVDHNIPIASWREGVSTLLESACYGGTAWEVFPVKAIGCVGQAPRLCGFPCTVDDTSLNERVRCRLTPACVCTFAACVRVCLCGGHG